MANIFWMKRDTDNLARALESTKGPLHCPKISRTLIHKQLKIGPEFFYPPSVFCSAPSPLHTLYAGLTWRPRANLNKTAVGLSAAQIRSSKKILTWQHRAALSGNASFIVTFSIVSCSHSACLAEGHMPQKVGTVNKQWRRSSRLQWRCERTLRLAKYSPKKDWIILP